MTIRSLRAELRLYDGKHTDVLERIASEHEANASLVRSLLTLARDNDGKVRAGAIWLIRRLHREGYRFTAAQVRAIVRLFLESEHWEPRLNLLQVIDTLPVAPGDRAVLVKGLEAATKDENAFVRAWAWSALYAHSRDLPTLRRRVDAGIEAAANAETPAVRARLRRVQKAAKRRSGA